MTPQAAAPGAPVAGPTRGVFAPTLALGPVVVIAGAVLGGGRAALAACLGFLVVVAFFGLGQLVTRRLSVAVDPPRFVARASAVVLGQLIFLLLVILALRDAAWLDGPAFGLSALAVALAWQVFQVIAFVRSRRVVFDAPDKTRQDGTPPT